MLLRFILALFTAGLWAGSFGQPAQAKAQLVLAAKSAPAGSTVKAIVKLTIPPGYHAYPNPPSKDYMIPVRVAMLSKDCVLKEAAYPEGKEVRSPGEAEPIRVYEGTIEIPIQFSAPKRPGGVLIKVSVNYQLCAGAECYPPEDVVAGAKLTVTSVKK